MSLISKLFVRTFAAALVGLFTISASAQAWPSRTIRVIVPQAPGGANDVVSRLMAESLGAALKQTVIIENRPGAGALLGTNIAATAEPDGYTLLAFGDANTFPTTIKLSQRDPITSFAPITLMGTGVHVLVAHPSLPVKSLQDVLALARRDPKALSAALPSLTGPQFVALETIKARAGVQIAAIPYKGGGQAVVDVLGGQVPLGLLGMAPVMNHIRTGKLKAIAVTGRARTALLPDVPTVAESGFPGFETLQWLGLVAPAGTPVAVIERLHREVQAISRDPAFIAKLADVGLDSVSSASPAEFGRMIREEVERWPVVLKAAGVTLE
jgi:tripartite-type tricarboxylate transporter receptor subunit TctC